MPRRFLVVLVVLSLSVGALLGQTAAELQTIDDFRAWLKAIEPQLTSTGVTNARNISTRLNTLKGQFKPVTPPPPLVELCNPDGTGNGIDENGDGRVDEGCTQAPPPPPAGAVLASLSVSPSSVAAGGAVTITATLTGPQSGARDVLLSASPSGVLTVPAAIRVKEAATSGSVQATAGNPQTQTIVTITGTLGTDTTTASVTVDASSTPPPTQELCGNGVDDNGDGQIDEGCVVVPPPTGNHGYFNSLVALTQNLLRAYSLRDPAQLTFPNQGGYAHSNTRPLVVTYDPTHDPDPRRQDAAKVTIGTSSNSLTNQIHLPIPPYSGALLVTWDAWFGKEFAYAVHGIQNYKNFQLASGGGIWTEVRSRFNAATSGNISLVDLRYYGIPGPGFFVGNLDALSPTVGAFQVAPETWTRYWVFLNPTGGTYTELSLWVADPTHGPTQILDRALVTKRNGLPWDQFWLEYNTSNDTVKPGRPELISYARNVVMLKGLSDPTPLLIKP